MIRPLVSFAACTLAAGLASADDARLAKLAKDMQATDAKVRQKAIEDVGMLKEKGGPLAKELCAATTDSDKKCATAALAALEAVRPDLHPHVEKILRVKHADKWSGMRGLVALGEDGKAGVRVLHHVLRQDVRRGPSFEDSMAAAAVQTLIDLKADDADTVELMRTLATPGGPSKVVLATGGQPSAANEPLARALALDFLIPWAGDDEARRKTLIPIIKAGFDNNETVLKCVKLAAEYNKLSKGLLPALRQLRRSPQADVRDAAKVAIDKIEKAIK
jgi:hypothetical protein